MAKVKLELGATIETASPAEIGAELRKASAWQREAAEGVRHIDIPVMRGAVDGSGNLTLGGDQADQNPCGPRVGWYWAIKRLSADGLAANEVLKILKGTGFIGKLSATPGYLTFGKGELTLKSGDFLRITGSGLTNGEVVTITGEAVTVPGPLMYKLFE